MNERPCARLDCDRQFVPRRSSRRYCSSRCANIDRQRRFKDEKKASPSTQSSLILSTRTKRCASCDRYIVVSRSTRYCSRECKLISESMSA